MAADPPMPVWPGGHYEYRLDPAGAISIRFVD
jgi:hypothetical protein